VAKRNYYPLATVAKKKKMSTANTVCTLYMSLELLLTQYLFISL
jgi:hypothetical protein